MKKQFIAILISLMASMAFGQTTPTPNVRFIDVVGSAEMTVPPDEIELSISIVGDSELSIEGHEKSFYKILEKHKISKEFVSLNNNDYWWWHWWWYDYRRRHERTYKLKVKAGTDMLGFVKDLKQTWVTNLSISKSTHSLITKYRKDVKIEAVKAAKAKAEYMLEALGEEIGKALTVEEVNTDNQPAQPWYYRNLASNSISNSNVSMNSGGGDSPEPDNTVGGVGPIKLRYEVKVRFEIK